MVVNRKVLEFEWDKGNIGKNLKHNVSDKEAEEVFFDREKIIKRDLTHSQKEQRNILVCKTKEKRLLYIVFTIRGRKVRIISARDVNKKEVYLYEKTA